MPDLIARLNAALGTRYVVERELRTGGMATVLLAHDVKHGRQVAIKVLDPQLAASLGAERFLREISIAAGLTHPHIVPLHDSGEADGLLYYVMPYVEGDSLRDRMDREGPLPINEAVRIACEVAHALAYAHEQGVAHRDIKPANILLASGEAMVADFGIARAVDAASDVRLTQAGMSTGTPLYMSPEQAEGEDVDARSDVFSLGCVLYEMLTGSPPWEGPTLPAVLVSRMTDPVRPVHETRESVPEGVEQAVLQALQRLPADRFSTAGEFAAALEPHLGSGGHAFMRPASRKRWWVRAAAVVLPVAVVAALLLTRSTEGLGFAERDWIIISDLENHTGDAVFDRSLNTALNVAVAQSQYVNVFPRARVYETLRRMGRGDVTVIDPTLAAEVAVRENLKGVVSFQISSLGDTYLLSTAVLDPESAVAVYSETARARGKEEVLGAVDELAKRLRSGLGESLTMVRQRSVPLPRATTTSLEALKRYTDGSMAWSQSRWEEARTLWREAVELDSTFAWAHASLGQAAEWMDGFGQGEAHYQKALGLLDRVTERERLWIRALIEDGEPMVETLRIFTRQYPDDRDAWYNLGNGLRSIAAPEEALEAYGHALALDSLYLWAHINSAMVLNELGRDEEAVTTFATAFRLSPAQRSQSSGDINRISGFASAKVGDTVAARETFELLLDGDADERANGLRSLALLDMAYGRVAAAIPRLREAINLSQTAGSRLSEFRNRLYLASAYTSVGAAVEARRQRAAAEEIARAIEAGPDWLVNLVRQHARAGAVERAGGLFDFLTETWDGPDAETFVRVSVEQARGELSLARGDHADAIRILEGAHGYLQSPARLEALARAYHQAGRLDEARSAYEDFLSIKRLGDELQALWLEAHVDLGRVDEELGDSEGAGEWYRALLDMVAEGDEALVVRREAEEGLERLAAR